MEIRARFTIRPVRSEVESGGGKGGEKPSGFLKRPAATVKNVFRAKITLERLGWSYSLGSALALVLYFLAADRPAVEFAANFLAYLLLPSFFVLLPAIVFRRKTLAALSAFSSLAFVILYGPAIIPSPFVDKAGDDELLLLVYNMHDEPLAARSLAEMTELYLPDVIALQEADHELLRPVGGIFADRGYKIIENDTGNLFLSRAPVRWIETGGPAFPAVAAVVKTNNREITVMNVHLPPPCVRKNIFSPILARSLKLQRAETEKLLAWSERVDGPLLLVGDFNFQRTAVGYGKIAGRFRDAWVGVGWGFGNTWPNGLRLGAWETPPLIRIDHAFSSPELTTIEARVLDYEGSDHLPLLFRFAATGRAASRH